MHVRSPTRVCAMVIATALAAAPGDVRAADDPPTAKTTSRARAPWMWIGFGTSLGLTTVFAAGAIGASVRLNNGLRDDLLAAVDASNEDDKPENDISRGEPDLCAAARFSPLGDGNVTNAPVTKICNKADGVKTVRNTMIGFAVAGLASTVVFSILLAVNPKPRQRALSIAPQFHPRGGSLALVGRF